MINQGKKIFDDVSEFPKNITIDLAARYAAAFAIQPFGNLIDKLSNKKKESENIESAFEFYSDKNSDFEKVSFEINFKEKDGKIYNEKLEFGSVLKGNQGSIFAPPLMMTFSQEKSLIETEVNDDDPIVIERWGTKPWDISIQGLLIDLENRLFPSDEIRKLNDVWSKNTIVTVEGLQFEDRKIDAIYFKSIDFTPLEGFQDTVQFSIKAKSIKSVSFTLAKPNVTIEVGSASAYQLDGTAF